MALTAAEQALRKGRLTGTSTAAALGVHPYLTRLYAYRAALGIAKVKITPPMEWGLRLEPVVAAKFAENRGLRLEDLTKLTTRQHPRYPFWASTGDYMLPNGELLEIKTAGKIVLVDMFEADEEEYYSSPVFDETFSWGPPLGDDIPAEYIIQTQVEMECYEREVCHVAVLIGRDDYREYVRFHDQDFADVLAAGAEDFYKEYILADKRPEAETTGELLQYLKERYPVDSGKIVEATEEIEQKLDELLEFKSILTSASIEVDTRKAIIQEFMGDAAVLKTRHEKPTTYKNNRPSIVVDYKGLALSQQPPAKEIERFTSTKPGNRVFLPK